MTVAAVILAASPESALADADGTPAVRRIADSAWAGGATPVVVVSADPEGSVARALANGSAMLAAPAPRETGPVGQITRGIDTALDSVAETSAALVWPARLAWVDPETVTSLIENHGPDPESVLQPSYEGEGGWPILLPLEHLERFASLAADRMPADLFADLAASGVAERSIDLGDPGTTHDVSTARADLPPYVGPPEPPAGHVHEWGEAVAETPDEGPLEGPALAPYGPA